MSASYHGVDPDENSRFDRECTDFFAARFNKNMRDAMVIKYIRYILTNAPQIVIEHDLQPSQNDAIITAGIKGLLTAVDTYDTLSRIEPSAFAQFHIDREANKRGRELRFANEQERSAGGLIVEYGTEDSTDDPVSDPSDQEEIVLSQMTVELDKDIQTLPPRHRMVLLQYHYAGKDLFTVSQMLGIQENEAELLRQEAVRELMKVRVRRSVGSRP